MKRVTLLLILLISLSSTQASPDAESCENAIKAKLIEFAQEGLKDDENLQKLFKQRSQIALIRGSLTLLKARGLKKNQDKSKYNKLLSEFDKEHTGYNKNNSQKMKDGLNQYINYIDQKEQSYSKANAKSAKAINALLGIPSKHFFKDRKDLQVNSVDNFFLRKAVVTARKSNPSLMSVMLKEMRDHMPERSFDISDESAMKAALKTDTKEFKDTLAKSLVKYLKKAVAETKDCDAYKQKMKVDHECEDCLNTYVKSLFGKGFSLFDNLLTKLGDDQKIELGKDEFPFLHVAPPIAKLSCKLKKVNGKEHLVIQGEFTNFEGIKNSRWSMSSTESKKDLPLSNPDSKSTYGREISIDITKTGMPEKVTFSHTDHVDAKVRIELPNGKSVVANSFDPKVCLGLKEPQQEVEPIIPAVVPATVRKCSDGLDFDETKHIMATDAKTCSPKPVVKTDEKEVVPVIPVSVIKCSDGLDFDETKHVMATDAKTCTPKPVVKTDEKEVVPVIPVSVIKCSDGLDFDETKHVMATDAKTCTPKPVVKTDEQKCNAKVPAHTWTAPIAPARVGTCTHIPVVKTDKELCDADTEKEWDEDKNGCVEKEKDDLKSPKFTLETSDTHVKISMKTKLDCRMSTCNAADTDTYLTRDKSEDDEDTTKCTIRKKKSYKFARLEEELYKVYVQCRKKGSEDDYEPVMKGSKQRSFLIDLCEADQCFLNDENENKIKQFYPPPPLPNRAPTMMPIPSMPILFAT